MALRGNVYTNETFPIIKASYWPSITAASGGTQLQSVDVGLVEIKNLSGNHDMYVGGIDTDAPFSGHGMLVDPGEKARFYVNNAAALQVCAAHSGELIVWIGYSNGTNVNMDPNIQGSRPDTTPPSFTAWSPVSGTTDLTSGGSSFTIIATFSETLQSSTVNTSSFLLRLAGSSTNLSGTVTACGENIVFTPVSGIFAAAINAPSTSANFIPIVLGSGNTVGVTDLGGNFINTLSGSYFTETSPTLSSWSPVSGAADVFSGLGTPQLRILAQFDRGLLSGTVSISSFILRLSGSSTNISGSVEVSGTNCTFVLASGAITTTSAHFSPIVLGSGNAVGIQDLAGNFVNTVSGDFITETGPII